MSDPFDAERSVRVEERVPSLVEESLLQRGQRLANHILGGLSKPAAHFGLRQLAEPVGSSEKDEFSDWNYVCKCGQKAGAADENSEHDSAKFTAASGRTLKDVMSILDPKHEREMQKRYQQRYKDGFGFGFGDTIDEEFSGDERGMNTDFSDEDVSWAHHEKWK